MFERACGAVKAGELNADLDQTWKNVVENEAVQG